MGLLSLLLAFLKVGLVSYGGGWSVVGLIRAEVVPRWIDEAGFASLMAIAQVTPGPLALNAATLVGFSNYGVGGAVLATLSVVTVPVLLILAAGILGSRLRLDREALRESSATGAMAMMLMTLWYLLPFESPELLPLALGLGSFALGAFTKLSPLWAILGSGVLSAAAAALAGALGGSGPSGP